MPGMSTSRIAASGGDVLPSRSSASSPSAASSTLVALELESTLKGFADCPLVVDHEDLHRA